MSVTSAAAGLYVHVPFCARACPYCDFDFEVGRSPDVDAYLAGLEAEIDARPELSAVAFDTVYLGGGTPSAIGRDGLARVFERLRARLPGMGSAEEITVEVNPEHASADLLAGLVEIGVDRLSLGTQTLDPVGLRELGRVHDRKRALSAVRDAVGAGVRVSADLIVGWRGQTRASLEADIDGLLGAGAEHLSCYALTIEPGTPWEGLVRRGLRVHPDPEQQSVHLSVVEELLVEAGLEHYEVSSYARAGARSRHNLRYWTWKDYVGLGPSAASAHYAPDGTVTRRTNRRGVAAWTQRPGEPADAETLPPAAAAAEGLWIGLRALDGIEVDRFLARFSAVDRSWVEERTRRQVERGNLRWEGPGRLRVAPGRWLFHDTIALDLVS
jgi:oxygen-independent coproporphyrinogen-3 oxidase